MSKKPYFSLKKRLLRVKPWDRNAAVLIGIRVAMLNLKLWGEMLLARVVFFFKVRGEEDIKPHFLGIGAQKAATSWLDQMLRHHPDLFLPRQRKEVHYFDQLNRKSSIWYKWHFLGGKGKVCGEITPSYSILPVEQIRAVYRCNPEMKILLILRNPVERAWSMAKMDILKQAKKDINQLPADLFWNHIRSTKSQQRGDYASIINNWNSIFPKEQIRVEFYEDLVEDPKEFLVRVFSFLGVKSHGIDFENIPVRHLVNQTEKFPPPGLLLRELCQIYKPKVDQLYEILPRSHVKSWQRDISNILGEREE